MVRRRAIRYERRTVMRRYQRARRVLPAVAGGMYVASHVRMGGVTPPRCGEQTRLIRTVRLCYSSIHMPEANK